MSSVTDLRELLDGTTAYYQPIVDLNTGRVVGAETLARFTAPDGKMRLPG